MENTARCYGCMRTIEKEEKICPHCGFDGNHYATKFYQLKLGTMLSNRYVIGKMLGEGGFGITYIAWDRNLEVPVAVKEYYPYGLVNRDTTTGNKTVFTLEGAKRESFEVGLTKVINEARRMAKFRNMSGIVSVVDFFKENGTAYIVMEYVDGITFNEYLKKHGKVLPEQVLKMFCPLIWSLSQVHKSGIIHRDISPDNIMINSNGEIRLLDFGAARDYGEDEKSLSIMLKRGFAPEEQYRSKGKQGPWTDVYALCATMYKMMTGITPDESLDRMAEDGLKSPTELGIIVDTRVESILLKGLAVFQQNRIPDMEELYKSLYGNSEESGFIKNIVTDFDDVKNNISIITEEPDMEGTQLIQDSINGADVLPDSDVDDGTQLLQDLNVEDGTFLLQKSEIEEGTQLLQDPLEVNITRDNNELTDEGTQLLQEEKEETQLFYKQKNNNVSQSTINNTEKSGTKVDDSKPIVEILKDTYSKIEEKTEDDYNSKKNILKMAIGFVLLIILLVVFALLIQYGGNSVSSSVYIVLTAVIGIGVFIALFLANM